MNNFSGRATSVGAPTVCSSIRARSGRCWNVSSPSGIRDYITWSLYVIFISHDCTKTTRPCRVSLIA